MLKYDLNFAWLSTLCAKKLAFIYVCMYVFIYVFIVDPPIRFRLNICCNETAEELPEIIFTNTLIRSEMGFNIQMVWFVELRFKKPLSSFINEPCAV